LEKEEAPVAESGNFLDGEGVANILSFSAASLASFFRFSSADLEKGSVSHPPSAF
jgi:hypothetical protein